MKTKTDYKAGKSTFKLKGQEIQINLEGMSAQTLYYLAIMGAHEAMAKRKDPKKWWNKISTGGMFREKQYRPIVQAISLVKGIPPEDAEVFYSELSRKEKADIRKDSRIQSILLELNPRESALI